MSQSLLDVWIHLVWTTKYRSNVLIGDNRDLIIRCLSRIASEKGYQIKIINGTENHLHCLLRIKGSQSISKIMNNLKGISSRWINRNQIVPGHFEWQNGYSAFSVSPWDLKKITKYIENQ
jgi:REP element-mobilizing transposase RayT